MPTVLFFDRQTVLVVCVSQDMLLPMQKRNREYAASLEMHNAGLAMIANGNIKITVLSPRGTRIAQTL